MAFDKNDDYVFERHYRASARLNLQHYHWLNTVGHLIHPELGINREQAQVLDVGCGTGVWVTDVSRSFPSSASFVGTDINLDQCPSKNWLPPNVSFQHWDIMEEPPAEFLERFDLVHLCLLNFVIKDGELVSALARITKTIKPGGWIQWGEYDHPSNTIARANPQLSSTNFETLLNRLRGGVTHPNWVGGLENRFLEQSLEFVQSFHYMPPRDCLPSIMDTVLMGLEEIIIRKSKDSTEELVSLLARATDEVRNGIAWTGPRVEVIGQKPSKQSSQAISSENSERKAVKET